MARANLNFLQRLQFAVRRGMDHLGDAGELFVPRRAPSQKEASRKM